MNMKGLKEMKELVIKKCLKCGAIVKVINDCKCPDCGIRCCDEPMKEMKANSTDGSREKHIPTYTIENDKLIVTVNHVMDDDHYIEWICLLTDNIEKYYYFNPGEEAKIIIDNIPHGKIYSYCNKHGLWVTDIK